MLGADATIAWVDDNGVAQAQDYFLGNYVQVKHISALCVTSRVDNMDTVFTSESIKIKV